MIFEKVWFYFEKQVFGEMCIRPNVNSGKSQCWKIGFRGNVRWAKCTFWQVSVLENRFSGKYPFGQMYILESVHSGKFFSGKCFSGECFSGRCKDTFSFLIRLFFLPLKLQQTLNKKSWKTVIKSKDLKSETRDHKQFGTFLVYLVKVANAFWSNCLPLFAK